MPLFENVDLTSIHSILWTDLHRDGPGRPVEYQPEWDLRALMLRQLEQIPYIKDLVKRLRRNAYLRRVCGYGDRAPCEAHFTQMKKRIGADGFRLHPLLPQEPRQPPRDLLGAPHREPYAMRTLIQETRPNPIISFYIKSGDDATPFIGLQEVLHGLIQ